MPVVFGETPRPRALLMDLPEDQENAIGELFPTIRVVSEFTQVDQRDYDVAVIGPHAESGVPAAHVLVVSFGRTDHGPIDVPESEGWAQYRVSYGSDSTNESQIRIADILPRGARELVAVLAEALQRMPVKRVLSINSYFQTMLYDKAEVDRSRVAARSSLFPFLSTFHDGKCLAGRFKRRGGLAEWWALPSLPAVDMVAWTRVAIDHWRDRYSERFPSEEWRLSPTWQTPDEIELCARHAQFQADRAATLDLLRVQEAELLEQLRSASEEADSGPRSVLTAQGGELVAEVTTLLEDLGFEVTDMDAIRQEETAALLEDLQVRDPADGDFVAIVEVRGYRESGGKTSDLGRLSGRMTSRFARENDGRDPSACWYIVNHRFGRPPNERDAPLAGSDEDVADFAGHSGGLIIPTTALFEIWQRVQLGGLGRGAARAMLRSSTGILRMSGIASAE